ncbi:Glycosyltransferase, GT2 family [Geodermatophilus pulveris]|uniref:Glycosyltransferase, GT2 family n=1 Tax=Geodermatophilus pulveris TaxID=1564159 RepID=A0A239GVY3_9ACTN|nr:glycosyltransferase [Geodermatophilus pulveris]SNS73386.1 Glycosyltransferase, GT2 family [Geodermatophilus pulveris]
MRAGGPPRCVVAVLTYRRTGWLPALLAELEAQAGTVLPRADVVVVDNDPEGSAAGVVGAWAGRGVRYAHEPRPGISAARNRALAEAGDADLLVFVDDDELPSAGWLAHLVAAWSAWGCAAVAGPVPARFLGAADAWVSGSGVFDRRRLPTGTQVSGAGAGNLLLDLHQVRALGLAFDERFGLTGGEDTLFTHALVRRGADIRWCDEAEAVEFVPADRLTRAWVLRRSFRAGSSWSRAEVHLADGAAGRWRTRLAVLAKAAVRVPLAGLGAAGALLRRDVAARARAVTVVASYAGLVVGAFGYVLGEYARRPAGTPPVTGGPAPDGEPRVLGR